MKPRIVKHTLDGDVVGYTAEVTVLGEFAEAFGATPAKAFQNLERFLRRQVAQGNAAQTALYLCDLRAEAVPGPEEY